MLAKGDRIKLMKPMGIFTNVGEVCKVVEISEDGTIFFSFGDGGMHLGCMSADEFEKYFIKYEDSKHNTITDELIEDIINHSKIIVDTVFDKCTVVSCQLPNGFVIVESSACVDPVNYDEEMGIEICMNKIVNKVWELEGYRLQQMLFEGVCDECEDCTGDCWDCNQCCTHDEEDECCYNDLDCDDCSKLEDCDACCYMFECTFEE